MNTQALFGMAVAAWLVGCASTSGARSEPAIGESTVPDHKSDVGMMDNNCPMKVPGTTVTPTDVESGIALAFVTSTGNVADLRHRVREMAKMHKNHHASGSAMMAGQAPAGAAPEQGLEHGHGVSAASGNEGGDRGGIMMGGMVKGGMVMPASTAAIEDVEGGALLVLRPDDPTKLEALRKHVRMHAERMAGSDCPMMSPGAKEQVTPTSIPGEEKHEEHDWSQPAE